MVEKLVAEILPFAKDWELLVHFVWFSLTKDNFLRKESGRLVRWRSVLDNLGKKYYHPVMHTARSGELQSLKTLLGHISKLEATETHLERPHQYISPIPNSDLVP